MKKMPEIDEPLPNRPLTPEEHRERHELLHQMFDELLADFLIHNRDKLPSNTSLLQLMEWSRRQTIEPEESGA